jgi:hypothetical protein
MKDFDEDVVRPGKKRKPRKICKLTGEPHVYVKWKRTQAWADRFEYFKVCACGAKQPWMWFIGDKNGKHDHDRLYHSLRMLKDKKRPCPCEDYATCGYLL